MRLLGVGLSGERRQVGESLRWDSVGDNLHDYDRQCFTGNLIYD